MNAARWWGRFVARTAVRRVVYVLVGLLIAAAMAWVSPAHAQSCSTKEANCTRPQAYAAARSSAQSTMQNCAVWYPGFALSPALTTMQEGPDGSAFYYWQHFTCGVVNGNLTSASGSVAYWTIGCPADQPWNPETGTCGTPNPCRTDDPPLGPSWFETDEPGTFSVCSGECGYLDNDTSTDCARIDGKFWCSSDGWIASGLSCSVTPDAPLVVGAPPTDSDGDGTSDGFDSSPNNPGSGGGGGPDGVAQPEDGQCGGPGQPECGTPGSGSGNGNTSGGGGNCSTPPSSSGDAILAQIAYQSWATRCAVEGLGNGNGNGNGDGDQPEWTKGNQPAVDEDGTDYVTDSKRFGLGIGPDMLNDDNIFGGGACPMLTVSVFGYSVTSADVPQWCQIVAIMRAVILIVGAFTALGILLGRGGV